jgi:hypothetical protein
MEILECHGFVENQGYQGVEEEYVVLKHEKERLAKRRLSGVSHGIKPEMDDVSCMVVFLLVQKLRSAKRLYEPVIKGVEPKLSKDA